MIKSLIYRLLKHRHFWRFATFDEIAELYASRLMRVLAQFMINMFVAIFLYQEGYSLLFIALYYAACFAFRAAMVYLAAQFVAKFGSKHGILASNLLFIPALIGFALVPQIGILAIIAFGVFQSLSMVINDLAHTVDFSKVKHVEHVGKEIGFMRTIERITASLSPLIGGVVAFLISPEATMVLSAFLFSVASIPLFRTKEPTRLNQKLNFRRFPWRGTWRSIVGQTAIGFDIVASGFVWVLFIAVVILADSTNDIYLAVGALLSITAVTAFFSAYAFGKIIDRRHGGDLLRFATLANAVTHLLRSVVTTPAGVAAANITNEVATTGYSMAYLRGIFDTADYVKGYRIMYLSFISFAMNIGGMFACFVFAGLLVLFPDGALAFQLFFVITSVYVLLPMTVKFYLYR